MASAVCQTASSSLPSMTGGVEVRTMRTVLRASAEEEGAVVCALARKLNSASAEQTNATAADSPRIFLPKTVISLRPTLARSPPGAVYRRGGGGAQSFL